jgi:hypothetical protein
MNREVFKKTYQTNLRKTYTKIQNKKFLKKRKIKKENLKFFLKKLEKKVIHKFFQ